MLTHADYQKRLTEILVEKVLARQNTDEASPLFGAADVPYRGYWGGENGTGTARQLILGYYLAGQKYCGDEQMLARAAKALRFVLRQQKDDGTFDLKETNLHDGAQTAFFVTTLGPIALLMRKLSRHTPPEEEVYTLLTRFIDHSADGMVNGGFHTPNHRWVMASALAMCHELTGREDCLSKMRLLLNEGIDQDGDGEYTEHSGGVYNVVCDRAFILLGFFKHMPEMFEIVVKNLRMVYKYIEPDLTINTLNSSRQDAGTAPDWRKYYDLYLFMALITGDREFRFIADRMLEQSAGALSWAGLRTSNEMSLINEYLPLIMMDASLQGEWDAADTAEPDFNYVKLFENSGVLRLRKGDFTLTLVKNNPNFMQMKFGRHSALLRLCGTFYAQGQFEAQELLPTENGWRMTYRRRWGYKSPLPERQQTTDWRKMDHSKRADVMMQDFVFTVDVEALEKGARLKVRAEGIECVMTKLEVLLECGGDYACGGTFLRSKKGDYVLFGAPKAVYTYSDGSALHLTGGFVEDTYAEHMRGSLPPDAERFTVAMTAETPMEKELTLAFAD